MSVDMIKVYRERIDELEETVRQLREMLALKDRPVQLPLTPQQLRVVRIIARRGPIGTAELAVALFNDNKDRLNEHSQICVQVFRARHALKEANCGIEIRSRARTGYWLDKQSLNNAREAGII